MINKRLIGSIVIKNNWAVQSFGYKKYLPLGNPISLVKNLNRWGVDEILINVIDRSNSNLGPDFNLLKEIQSLNIDTPLIYSGGIQNLHHAKEVFSLGADRIVIESIIENNFNELKKIVSYIGSQSIIASIPIVKKKEKIFKYNYKDKNIDNISKNKLIIKNSHFVSEFLITDVVNEGYDDQFNIDLIKKFPLKNKKLICFGGIRTKKVIEKIFKNKNISAIAIGNSLNFKEHSVQNLKKRLSKKVFRKEIYKGQ